MGSHFGHGGTVVGETIKCPFHAFCFDTQGTCTKTGYDTKPPPGARLGTWPLQESHGMLLVYHHPEKAEPTWRIPAFDTDDWTPLKNDMWTLRSHPQKTTENSVDLGHFAIVHGYTNTEVLSEVVTEGPLLKATYAMVRTADVFGQGSQTIRTEFEAKAYGLGYSIVDVWVEQYDLKARVWVLPTPTDGEHIDLRAAVSVSTKTKPSNIHWGLALLPKSWAMKLIRDMAFKGYAHDLKQDFHIWEHKVYVDPAPLARGDGPIATYRKWCRQFYVDSPRKLEKNEPFSNRPAPAGQPPIHS